MTGKARIATRCTRIAQMVDAPVRDQTTLLRAARMLKTSHEELTQSNWQQARTNGWNPAGAEATQSLESAEQHLRRALLEYATLPATELRDLVVHALHELLHTMDLLEGSAEVTLARAM